MKLLVSSFGLCLLMSSSAVFGMDKEMEDRHFIASGQHASYPDLTEAESTKLYGFLTVGDLAECYASITEEDKNRRLNELEPREFIASGLHPSYPNLPEADRMKLYRFLTDGEFAGFDARLAEM